MKQNKSSRSTVLLFLLGAALIVAALIMLVPDLLNYKQSNDTYEALKENYVSEKAENTEVEEDTEGEDSWWYTDVDVNLEELQQVNADIIGWIRFDNLEQLSYPILYSGDDEKYLRTDIYGNQTIAGCIFMEGMNTPDFQDYHTILYGHNMKNGSMFGSIHSFEDETFFDGHPYIYVYTENERLTYEIYEAAKFTDVYIPSEYVISSKDDRDQFLADVREKVSDNKLHVREDMEIGEDDRLITLSTCVSGERNHRYLVIGVLVETALYR